MTNRKWSSRQWNDNDKLKQEQDAHMRNVIRLGICVTQQSTCKHPALHHPFIISERIFDALIQTSTIFSSDSLFFSSLARILVFFFRTSFLACSCHSYLVMLGVTWLKHSKNYCLRLSLCRQSISRLSFSLVRCAHQHSLYAVRATDNLQIFFLLKARNIEQKKLEPTRKLDIVMR